jgi:signal peptidase I
MPGRTPAVAAACLGGLLALRLWVVEPITVSSTSMEPTVPAGSVVWLNKAGPQLAGVRPGQLVVFTGPDDGEMPNQAVLLKRVVAAAGQTVAIRDGVLYVDGTEAREPYVNRRTIDGVYFGTVTVPPGQLFVLGDNRESSVDSRDFGPIPAAAVHGTVMGQ